MTADQILAIPSAEPERLFPNNEGEAAKLYRQLALDWHPDRSKDSLAPRVMAHLTMLYAAVQAKLKAGTWQPAGVYAFATDGKARTLRYKLKHAFELGEILIGTTLVSFLVDAKYEDYVIRGLRAASSIAYPSKKFKADLELYFPKVEKTFEDKARNNYVVVMRKDEDAILLSDLIQHCGGQLDPKHTAWIISCLLNLCCLLEAAKMTHNAISVDTVFVSPKRHTAFLLGGWWYATELGKPLNAVPPLSHQLMTSRERNAKKAGFRLDLECVREVGRVCMGKQLDALPKPLKEFLKFPASSSALADYESWAKVLIDSFGARRFVKLDVTPSAVY